MVATGPVLEAGTPTQLTFATVTVPQDAHFVHVTGMATLATPSGAGDGVVWVTADSPCGTPILSAIGYARLTSTADYATTSVQDVYAATAGEHVYRLCAQGPAGTDTFSTSLVATTEALNGAGAH